MTTYTNADINYHPHTNLDINDDERFRKHIKVLDKIIDGSFPSKLYSFFVEDNRDKVVYKCTTRKRILSREELYEIVTSCLPDGIVTGRQLLGTESGIPGHSFIKAFTDVSVTFDFTL